MDSGTYKCAHCEGVFALVNDENWNDDKARAEYEQNFGAFSEERRRDAAVICDDCYRLIMKNVA